MPTILDEVVANKLHELEWLKQQVPESHWERSIEEYHPPTRDFTSRINVAGVVSVIAEIKKSSPWTGVIRSDFEPIRVARTYCDHGAAAISVLTDWHYFQGEYFTIAVLADTMRRVIPPVLRKDFIIDRYQLLETRGSGADAILLIAECLPGDSLGVLHRQAIELGLHTLVEFHDAEQLPRVLDTGCKVIGINNRDLRTFATPRLEQTLGLLPRIPSDRIVVSEGGIASHEDLVRLGKAGVKAVLVGESLLRAPDIGVALDKLRGV
jgi:indole-3-glycerol phosphate synthase